MFRFFSFPEIVERTPLIALQRGRFGLFVPQSGSLEAPFRIERGEVLPVNGTDVYPLGVRASSRVEVAFEPTVRGVLEIAVIEDDCEIHRRETWGERLRFEFDARPSTCYELRLTNPSDHVVGYRLLLSGLRQPNPLRRLLRRSRDLVGAASS